MPTIGEKIALLPAELRHMVWVQLVLAAYHDRQIGLSRLASQWHLAFGWGLDFELDFGKSIEDSLNKSFSILQTPFKAEFLRCFFEVYPFMPRPVRRCFESFACVLASYKLDGDEAGVKVMNDYFARLYSGRLASYIGFAKSYGVTRSIAPLGVEIVLISNKHRHGSTTVGRDLASCLPIIENMLQSLAELAEGLPPGRVFLRLIYQCSHHKSSKQSRVSLPIFLGCQEKSGQVQKHTLSPSIDSTCEDTEKTLQEWYACVSAFHDKVRNFADGLQTSREQERSDVIHEMKSLAVD